MRRRRKSDDDMDVDDEGGDTEIEEDEDVEMGDGSDDEAGARRRKKKGKGKQKQPVIQIPQTPSSIPPPKPLTIKLEPQRVPKAWWLDVSSPSWEDMCEIGKVCLRVS